MKIPSAILAKIYNRGSLNNSDVGFQFSLTNRLSNVIIEEISSVRINDETIDPNSIVLKTQKGTCLASAVSASKPLVFDLNDSILFSTEHHQLEKGEYKIDFAIETKLYGTIDVSVMDSIGMPAPEHIQEVHGLPHDIEADYSEKVIKARQAYLESETGVKLEHINNYSFDPEICHGNIENFTGVAQIPLGFAGPLQVNGEYAKGEFIIPLATTEGTLVASYNRGMKLLNAAGGVTTTIQGDCMQRAPVFVFKSAREATIFMKWIDENIEAIREVAQSTSSVARLVYIDKYLSNKFAFLRFNFTTGDAAGQNMVGKATFAACQWIRSQVNYIETYYLESNLATDKKASQINVMHTRGKRVTAEATIPRETLQEIMHVNPETLAYHSKIANIGSMLSGSTNNGCHSPNGITAMFIATGQDVANVSECSTAILYTELTEDHDLYISITIPSLIVGTHGGGTGLATQQECLKILGCTGRNSVNRLAEIIAGVVLAGELSLASAISSLDWVKSHERLGRNR